MKPDPIQQAIVREMQLLNDRLERRAKRDAMFDELVHGYWDLVCLAEAAMLAANKDGAGFLITEELEESRELLVRANALL